eukprot:87882-Prorocentrum_minimum.AAC.1
MLTVSTNRRTCTIQDCAVTAGDDDGDLWIFGSYARAMLGTNDSRGEAHYYSPPHWVFVLAWGLPLAQARVARGYRRSHRGGCCGPFLAAG